MQDQSRSKKQLINELVQLRQQNAELEKSGIKDKQAEEALREAKDRLHSLFDGILVGFYRSTPEGKRLDANQAFMQMVRCPNREAFLKGNIVDDYVNPEDRKKWQAQMELKGVVRGFEAQCRRQDGTVFWMRDSARIVRDNEGQVLYYEGAVEDITERKQTEEDLKNALADWHSTFNSTEDLIMLLDKQFKIIRANLSTARFVGLDINEILGKKCYQLLHKTKAPPDICPLKKMKQTKKHEEAELYLAERDVWVVASIDPVFNDKGNLIRCVHVIKDITKRKKAQEELKSSEETLKILFEFAPDAYFVYDSKGNLVDCNKAAEKLMGYTKKELLGKSFLKLKLLPPDQIPKAVNGLAKVIMGKTRPPVEYTLKNKDGNQVEVEISTYPVKIRGRALATAIARDITERKKAEETEKQYAFSLAFLSRTAMEFVELLSESDIYQFIGKRLRELAGNSFVLVSSFDETTQCIQAQAFLGARKEIESILKILKKNPMEMSLPINEEARAGLTAGKLIKVPGGLYVLSFEKIPKHICTTLEKLLNLGDIYTMGFTRKGELFGNALIITRGKAGLEKKDLIETFIGQASVALQRRRAEEELLKYREHLEEMVEERTAEIKAANERLQRLIAERMNAEKALLESEAKLQKQKSALEQKNIALGEVIAQIEVEKGRIKDDIETNVNIVVSPILEKLKKEKASAKYVTMLKYHLGRLTSSFGSKITKKSFKLTPREIEVCNMVKGGLTSKDISNLLNISYRTIEKHRRNIRQKLGISNKRINLTSFLREF